jgi:hypothetical protein
MRDDLLDLLLGHLELDPGLELVMAVAVLLATG